MDDLLFTSTSRHASRNLAQARDTLSGVFSFGVPLVAIRYNALSGS